MDTKKSLVNAAFADGISAMNDAMLDGSNEVSSIVEALDFMNSSEICKFFSKLGSLTAETTSDLCDDDDSLSDGEAEMNQEESSRKTGQISMLRKIAAVVQKRMEGSKENCSNMIEIVEPLHAILIPLEDSLSGASSLKALIARICEKWWTSESTDSENLVTQLIPYLLITALSPSAHDADVKRLYTIRTALLLLDFEDETIESIRSLILRCFIHPAFLRVPDGRRFLSFLFSIHEGINSMIFDESRTTSSSPFGFVISFKNSQVIFPLILACYRIEFYDLGGDEASNSSGVEGRFSRLWGNIISSLERLF
jgi:hypothetical protein